MAVDCSLWSGNFADLWHARREKSSVLLAIVQLVSLLAKCKGWFCVCFSLSLFSLLPVRCRCVIIAELLRCARAHSWLLSRSGCGRKVCSYDGGSRGVSVALFFKGARPKLRSVCTPCQSWLRAGQLADMVADCPQFGACFLCSVAALGFDTL